MSYEVNKVTDFDSNWNTEAKGGDSLLESSSGNSQAAMDKAGLSPEEKPSPIINEDNQGEQGASESLLENQEVELNPDGSVKETTKEEKTETEKQPTEEGTPADIRNLEDVEVSAILEELFEKEVLTPWEAAEVKTTQDLVDLVKDNMDNVRSSADENIFEERLNNLSPQYQSIMKYGLNGGQNVQDLINQWGQVEETFNLDISNDEGQEQVVREYLKQTGYGTDEMINKDIATWRDLGSLQEKAEAYKPVLEKAQMTKIHQMEEEQRMVVQREQQFHENHVNTMGQALNDFKLEDMEIPRETKARLYDAAQPVYQSQITGKAIDALEAVVEELKYGQGDPELYLELMFHAADPEGFKDTLRSAIRSSSAVQRERRLRTETRRDISGASPSGTNTNTNTRSSGESW